MRHCGFRALPGASFLLFSALANAQCDPSWQPGLPVPGANGNVYDIVDDGVGGLYACGDFTIIGSTFASNVARWDGTAWHALGSGLDGRANAMVVMPNGDLVVGGNFDQAGGAPIEGLARWDGSSWSQIGSGLFGGINDLHLLPNGDLLVGGYFDVLAPTWIRRLARWDGTVWSTVGGDVDDGAITAITSTAQGDIVVGGTSQLAINGVSSDGLMIWDGVAWTAPSSIELFTIDAVLELPNGDIAFGGSLSQTGENLGTYDGVSVTYLTHPFDRIYDLMLDGNGDLLVAGYEASGTVSVARLSGGVVTVLDSESVGATALELHNGNLAAAGFSDVASGGRGLPSIREFDGVAWQGIGGSNAPRFQSVDVAPNGDVYVGGAFTEVAGVSASSVARFDGTTWTSLGSGIAGQVRELEIAPNGDVICFGFIAAAGGTPVQKIARWDGTNWHPLAGGLPAGLPGSMTVAPNGDVIAVMSVAPNFQVFDGNSWIGLPPMPEPAPIYDCTAMADGSLVFVGQTVAGFAWRWDGTSWSALGSSPAICDVVTPAPDGSLFVLGIHQSNYGVHHWNGTSLQYLGRGNGQTKDLDVMPNGDLLAVGTFTEFDGVPAPGIARYNGQTWSTVDGGIVNPIVASRGPEAVASGADGSINVVGLFQSAGNQVATNFARAETPCPATSVPFGAGCVGSAGLVQLQPVDQPFLGTTSRAQIDGMPGNSLAVYAIGTASPTVPLAGGVAGCSLFVQPAILDLVVPQNGVGEANLFLPQVAGLVGANLRTQAVVFELDPSLTITQVTSSNALDLTIGAF